MDQRTSWLSPNSVYCADSRDLGMLVEPDTVGLSVWSPPYHVGKEYERDMSFIDWKNMLRRVIEGHQVVLKPGGFMAINIADILCFKDASMPRIMAENISRRKRGDITREVVLTKMAEMPSASRHELANALGCSEQTVDRRLKGNNIRGGKYQSQTRVQLVGGLLEQFAIEAGLYLYDRRIWVKDAAWENSRWHTMSFRSVDEFEYVYIFWKPGPTKVDKSRLTRGEWTEWGSRGVWSIPSVRTNSDHDSKFPLELPRRLIQLLSDPADLVLDCFVGSGTSGVAAALENRRFIGIDRSERSASMASRAYRTALTERRVVQSNLFSVQERRARYLVE